MAKLKAKISKKHLFIPGNDKVLYDVDQRIADIQKKINTSKANDEIENYEDGNSVIEKTLTKVGRKKKEVSQIRNSVPEVSVEYGLKKLNEVDVDLASLENDKRKSRRHKNVFLIIGLGLAVAGAIAGGIVSVLIRDNLPLQKWVISMGAGVLTGITTGVIAGSWAHKIKKYLKKIENNHCKVRALKNEYAHKNDLTKLKTNGNENVKSLEEQQIIGLYDTSLKGIENFKLPNEKVEEENKNKYVFSTKLQCTYDMNGKKLKHTNRKSINIVAETPEEFYQKLNDEKFEKDLFRLGEDFDAHTNQGHDTKILIECTTDNLSQKSKKSENFLTGENFVRCTMGWRDAVNKSLLKEIEENSNNM